MRSRTIMLLAQALVLMCIGGAAIPSARGQTVGKTAAVNPLSNGAGKTLIVGAEVVHNEHVQTDAYGAVQILFLDRTTISIGPNSSMVIDDFVYNTKTGVGRMTVSLVKGALRFVGGQVTHSGEATVNTFAAGIGIRGGTAQISVDSQGTQAIFLGGNSPGAGITITPIFIAGGANSQGGAATIAITRTGFGSTVASRGSAPSAPVAVNPHLIQALNNAITVTAKAAAARGATPGGAPAGTARVAVKLSNSTAAAVASKTITVKTSPVANSSAKPVQQPGTVTSTLTTVLANAAQTVTQTTTTSAAQQNAALTIAQTVVPPPVVPPSPPAPSFAALPFALTMSACCGSGNPAGIVPYLPSGFASGGNYYVSPIYGFRLGSTNAVGTAPWLQYGINITGVGANQSSWFFVATGEFTNDGNGGLITSGGFNSMRRAGATFTAAGGGGVFTSLPNTTPQSGVQFDPLTMLPTGGTIINTNTTYDPDIGAYLTSIGTNNLAGYSTGNSPGNPNTSTNYNFSQTFTAITPPSGLGSYRPNVTLNGYVGGLMQPFVMLNQNGSPSDVTIQLDADTNSMQATFNVTRLGGSNANTFNTASYQFGSPSAGYRDHGIYVDYDTFGARQADTWTSTSTTQTATPASTVNGATFATNSAEMINVTPALAQQIAPGLSNSTVTFCQCDYTRWGFWATADTYGSNGNNGTFSNSGNLMLWVAGQMPNASDVPASGTATYSGHAIANIASGTGNFPSQYVAAGNFSNTVNFGTRTGAVSVTGLDNTNYSGSVNLVSNSTTFGGSLTGSTGGRTMALNGSFFKGIASPVGEMGGQISISGTNYLGAGIFAAKMQ